MEKNDSPYISDPVRLSSQALISQIATGFYFLLLSP